MNRGQLTQAIKERSKELLGYEIDTGELRLMAYVQYVMMNSQVIEPDKMGRGDRPILSKWRAAGHIEGGASGLSMTREFWDAICDILWMGYVAWGEDENKSE